MSMKTRVIQFTGIGIVFACLSAGIVFAQVAATSSVPVASSSPTEIATPASTTATSSIVTQQLSTSTPTDASTTPVFNIAASSTTADIATSTASTTSASATTTSASTSGVTTGTPQAATSTLASDISALEDAYFAKNGTYLQVLPGDVLPPYENGSVANQLGKD